jgi:hypothetical protein
MTHLPGMSSRPAGPEKGKVQSNRVHTQLDSSQMPPLATRQVPSLTAI